MLSFLSAPCALIALQLFLETVPITSRHAVNFVVNNLVSYNASLNLNTLYNFGFLLAILMILQIASGLLVTCHYQFSFSSIVYMVKELSTGWIIRYCHSMNCSMVHACLCIHLYRNLYYTTYLFTPSTFLSGYVLYLLVMAVSFLGYVLPYGQMSFWGATVITNIVALIPNLMEWLLGDYVMGTVTLHRFYLFHFLVSLVILLVILVHMVYLHKLGSTNPLLFSGTKISFFPYYAMKDLFSIFVVLLGLLALYLNYFAVSHSDNNLESNPLVTPLHIVPEWYFLPYYTILKSISNKVAGIVLFLAFFSFLANLTHHGLVELLSWEELTHEESLQEGLLLAQMMFILGAELPLAVYVMSAKILIGFVYLSLFHTRSQFLADLSPYYVVNLYTHRVFLLNTLKNVQYALTHVSLERNESTTSYAFFLAFIILSELLLFISFLTLVFDHATYWIWTNHYHLYYVGLMILAQASCLSSPLVLAVLTVTFATLQVVEYRFAVHMIHYDSYSSFFYLLTTLHLLHVLVGAYGLLYTRSQSLSVYSVSSQLWVSTQITETSILLSVYWNFVEAIWLLIFWVYSHFHTSELFSLNHKIIGLNYFLTSLYFGLVAIMYSLLMRVELLSSGNRILFEQNNFVYNYLISVHGLAMIFFFVMPIVYASVGNFLFPINLNSAELKLSKLNNFSLLLYVSSFVIVAHAALVEFGIGVGWTLYPPLSTYSINLSKLSLELVLVGLVLNGTSSLLSSINFYISLFYMMHVYAISTLSLYSVAVLMSAYMLILSLPVLSAGVISLLLDISLNTVLLDPAFGGDPVLYQHFFWFFGHPEVYIMILPSFGLINHLLIHVSQKCIFGASTMMLAILGISFLGFVVWSHHMYTSGMESDSRAYFTATTVMIAIPTGTKVFNWLVQIYSVKALCSPLHLLITFFVIIFLIGGVSGVLLGNAALDVLLHDTYYVVGHFHQVLAIGSVLSILAYAYHYKMVFSALPFLKEMNVVTVPLILVGLFVNINLLFFSMLWLGFCVLPRRIPEYADEQNGWNLATSLHALFVGVLLLIL